MFINIITHPIFILFALALFITMLMYIFVGRKKKNKKIEKAIKKSDDDLKLKDETKEKKGDLNTQKTDKLEEKSEQEIEVDKNFEMIKDENIDDKKEKRVSRVYIRRKQEQINKATDVKDEKYQELSDRAEFVKMSKTISKLNSFNSNNETQENNIAEENEEIKTNEVYCKSRIDHSRRLSESVKNGDFDKLFVSHIEERYLNIDSGRHISDKITADIYNRANKTTLKGESRALDPKAQSVYNGLKNDKDKLRFLMEQKNATMLNQNNDVIDTELEKDATLSLKHIIMADALLKRRSKLKK